VRRLRACGAFEHAAEHLARKQIDVLGEHAEDEPVDEMRDRLRRVAAVAQALRQLGEFGRRLLGQGLPR